MKPPVSFPTELERRFQEHNRRATWLALASLLGAAASWATAYLVFQWIGLLLLTTIRGLDAPATIGSGPQIATGVCILLVIGWVVRRWKTENHVFSWLIVIAGCLSVPARLTFAIFDNLQAKVYPSEEELAECWLFLTSLREKKKIALHEMRGISPSNVISERIIYLLDITDLGETDSYGGVFYLHLKNDTASRLIRRWSRPLEDNS